MMSHDEFTTTAQPILTKTPNSQLPTPNLKLIFLLLFVLAWIIGLVRPPATIDIGADDHLDRLFLETGSGGFFQPEKQPPDPQQPSRDITYRWTGRVSYIKLPWPLTAMPLKARLRATAPRPNLSPALTGPLLKVTGEQEGDRINLAGLDMFGFFDGRDYVFRIPAQLNPTLASFNLRFEATDTYQPGGADVRNLAIVFFNLKLEPDFEGFGWQGWVASFARPLLLSVLCLICWGLARLLTRRKDVAAWVATITAIILLLSLLFWPLDAEPYYAAWTFILLFGWLLAWVAGLFANRARHSLPTPFIWAATLFPIMPLAQFAFGRLNLYTLNSASVTISVYIGALLFCGGIFVATSYREKEQRNREQTSLLQGEGDYQRHSSLVQEHEENGLNFEKTFVQIMLGASIISFGYNLLVVFQTDLYRGVDFKIYYDLLTGYQQGRPFYNLDQLVNQSPVITGMPPSFGAILWPLTVILGANSGAALLIWRIFNVLLLLPTLLILLKVFGGQRNGCNYTPAVIFLTLNFGQITETIAYGQFNIMMLFGLALFCLWVKQGQAAKAGAILALPVGLKLYSLLLASFVTKIHPSPLRQRVAPLEGERESFRTPHPSVNELLSSKERGGKHVKWQFLGRLLISGAILTGLTGLAVGFDNVWLYLTEVFWKTIRPEMDISNQSIFGFFARLDTPEVMSNYKENISAWVWLVSWLGVLLCLLLTFLIWWKTNTEESGGVGDLVVQKISGVAEFSPHPSPLPQGERESELTPSSILHPLSSNTQSSRVSPSPQPSPQKGEGAYNSAQPHQIEKSNNLDSTPPATYHLPPANSQSSIVNRQSSIVNPYPLSSILYPLLLLLLIIPPFVWMHSAVIALIPLLALLITLSHQADDRKAPFQLLLFGLAYAMLGYGGRNDFFFNEAVGIARIGSSYRLLAVISLWLLSLYLFWRSSRTGILQGDAKN